MHIHLTINTVTIITHQEIQIMRVRNNNKTFPPARAHEHRWPADAVAAAGDELQ
jgi:hypothetical protein